MKLQDAVPTNGRPPALDQRGAEPDLVARLNATCRRHELVIDALAQRCATLRRGAAALKAENTELRVELARIDRRETRSLCPSSGTYGLAPCEVALAAEPRAAGAARSVIAHWLERRVPARVLKDAELVVSELVTNSVRHAGITAIDVVRVGVELAPDALRLEVTDPGSHAAIAPRSPDLATGTGYGLNILATLATHWGVIRDANTTVWAELTWANAVAAPDPG